MKKPWPEEKTDLRLELKILSLFFILISSDISFSQIPLNGFCKLTTFIVDSGYNNLSGFNFNKDSYSDLIIFNNSKRNILVAEGFGSGEFKAPINKSLPVSISHIQLIENDTSDIESYAFVSRADRIFGIYSFSGDGSADIILRHKFDSYPGRLSIADINGNNLNEFLISGSSFKGLSILSQVNKKISETRLFYNTSFNFAHFVDINNNGYKDIAAYNLNTGDIHFLYNDGEGNFSEVRKIPYQLKATQFRTFDINLNYSSDLIISSGKSIKIFYGDFRSSYDTTVTITTKFPVDDFIIGDFNGDGYFDIVYLSKDEGIVSSIFGKADGNFHKEFTHLKRSRIHAITHYISKFKNGVAYLAENGEVGLISKLNMLSSNFNLALSVEPESIAAFDNDLNGINDIVFIDGWSNSFNALVRNNEGIPDKIYVVPLFGNQSTIHVDNSKKRIKKFYCYSGDSRLLEIITIDFSINKVSREQLYAPGNIMDLIVSYPDEEHQQINITYAKSGKLFFCIYTFQNQEYLFFDYPVTGNGFIDSEIIPSASPIFSHWRIDNNKLSLYHSSIQSAELETELRQSIYTRQAEIFSSSKSSDNSDNYLQVSIIKSDDNSWLSLVSERNEKIFSAEKQLSGLRIKNKNHLSFDSGNSLFFYDESRKTVGKIETSYGTKTVKIQTILKDITASDFIILNLDFRNKHLIYSNKKNGSLSVRQIE